MGIFRPLTIGPACALEITSHIKYYYVARDSSVTLNCEFVLDSENVEHTEIEWKILAENRDQDDNTIIWYTAAMIYNNLYGPLKHRVYFTSPEPQNGIASLTISDLKLTDSGTYQCMVKKLPEIAIKNFILSVMERPSMPVCYMDVEAVAGEDLRLRCRSSQGTPPVDYRWSKTSGNQKLPHTAFADTIEGDLYLDKITESDTGTYLCTVLNLVGIEECELELSFPPPLTMYYVYVTIASAIFGVVLVINIIIIIAVICYRRRKETEEEFSSEILVDELPPYTWRTRESDTLGSWSYISPQGSVQTHTVTYENMDSSLRTKCTDKDAVYEVVEQQDLKENPEAYEPMEPGVTPRGEANKENPEAYEPIEHGVTPPVEAKVFRPRTSKSIELMKHGPKACGEGK
ncbi:coxsackievirus and adenovirus receptor homolog, partial [Seriola dumerili]|uniref:coxsackievirus and adenovirus receptor homolog n=1 Tax=Seriola dumerili TaxID=41447 RepID=UPI000BBED929